MSERGHEPRNQLISANLLDNPNQLKLDVIAIKRLQVTRTICSPRANGGPARGCRAVRRVLGMEEVGWNGLKRLFEIHTKVAGVVLSQVNFRRHTRYGCGDATQYYGKYTDWPRLNATRSHPNQRLPKKASVIELWMACAGYFQAPARRRSFA
jgi:hypothetical protein